MASPSGLTARKRIRLRRTQSRRSRTGRRLLLWIYCITVWRNVRCAKCLIKCTLIFSIFIFLPPVTLYCMCVRPLVPIPCSIIVGTFCNTAPTDSSPSLRTEGLCLICISIVHFHAAALLPRLFRPQPAWNRQHNLFLTPYEH